MRKKVFGKKLSRNRNSRKALFRSLMREMVLHDNGIKTTVSKANAVKPDLEKLFGLVKDGSLEAKRKALSMLGNDTKTADLLFQKYSEVSKNRTSGFTRITKLGARLGDNAELVKLEWVIK